MDRIGLQQKTSAGDGIISLYWFENSNVGLPRAKFYRIQIPLIPFNSGLEYEEQPVKTEVDINWLHLSPEEEANLDHLSVSSKTHSDMEASIYVGRAHNPCDVEQLELRRESENTFQLYTRLRVDFEFEGVAEAEIFEFATKAKYFEEAGT